MDIANYINTNDPFLLFFGSFYLVLGLSIFFAAKHWREFISLFIQNDSLSLVLGILSLPMSLSIIVFYIGDDTIGSTILIVLGYIGFIKSMILLLRPSLVQGFLNKGHIQKYLWVDGVSGIILGAAMLLL